jgi:YgiT-type zinc finger domain-containing protein
MKCEVCGIGERSAERIEYNLRIGDTIVVVQHVPASVCDHCGETSLSPDTVEHLQRTVWQARKPVKVLQTPVYDFAMS